MNARFSELKNIEFRTSDGPIGAVVDLLIDDKHWMVRYLVVSMTSDSLAGSSRVLISPTAISITNLNERRVETSLDSKRVQTSPPFDSHQSISRQHEVALAEHYGWPIYWVGQTLLHPQTLERMAGDTEPEDAGNGNSNLRSASEICGYQILSRSGKAGVMNDLVINLQNWRVENGVAESSTWLPLESSMFRTSHIESVCWSNREITVDLSKEVLLPVANQLSRSIALLNLPIGQPTPSPSQ